jgi:hypothetical protein
VWSNVDETSVACVSFKRTKAAIPFTVCIRHCVPSSGCHLLVARDSYFGVYTEQREHTSFLISRMVASFWRDEMAFVLSPLRLAVAAVKSRHARMTMIPSWKSSSFAGRDSCWVMPALT